MQFFYLLPRKNYFIILPVNHIHFLVPQNSIKEVSSELRACFWICSARKLIKSVIRKRCMCEIIEGGAYNYLPLKIRFLKFLYVILLEGTVQFHFLFIVSLVKIKPFTKVRFLYLCLLVHYTYNKTSSKIILLKDVLIPYQDFLHSMVFQVILFPAKELKSEKTH